MGTFGLEPKPSSSIFTTSNSVIQWEAQLCNLLRQTHEPNTVALLTEGPV